MGLCSRAGSIPAFRTKPPIKGGFFVWKDGIDVGTGQVPVWSRSESEVDTVGGPEFMSDKSCNADLHSAFSTKPPIKGVFLWAKGGKMSAMLNNILLLSPYSLIAI